MEWHRNHRLDFAQIHIHHAVIISRRSWVQFLIVLRPSMNLIEFPNLLIRLPNRRQTGCLCGHNVNSNTEIRTQLLHARTYELHDLIIHISISKCSSDDCKRHILRTYSLHGFAVQINPYHAGHLDIIGLIQKLLYKLRTAFSHCHSS